MAEDGKGWNQLKRSPSSYKTDNINIGKNITVHETYTFNKQGDITKSHTKVTSEGKSKRIGH